MIVGHRHLSEPPAWAIGRIGDADAAFLAALIEREAPRRVLEIGIGAGVSSAVILAALDALAGGDGADDRVLYSADVSPRFYANPHHATGEATEAIYPAARAQWRRRIPSDARRIGAELAPGGIDLVFIDGDHRHPCPLLDVLHVAPYAKPEAWIVLHDVALARILPGECSRGAEWVFAGWPWAKVEGEGAAENIGAVRLPPDLTLLGAAALMLLDLPWEATPRHGAVGLAEPFARVSEALRPRLAP